MSREREPNGHFKKGNEIGKETRFTTERTPAQENGRRTGGNDPSLAGKIGGHNSQIAKRERRTYAEIAAAMGELPASEVDKANLAKLGLPDSVVKDATQDAVVVAAQIMQAKAGNTKAAKWLRDTKGESEVKVTFDVPKSTIVRE